MPNVPCSRRELRHSNLPDLAGSHLVSGGVISRVHQLAALAARSIECFCGGKEDAVPSSATPDGLVIDVPQLAQCQLRSFDISKKIFLAAG